MSHHLTEGTELLGLSWPGDEGTLSVGEFSGVKRIVVTEEMGQMSMVPWARVEYADGSVRLFNLAHVDGVRLREAP